MRRCLILLLLCLIWGGAHAAQPRIVVLEIDGVIGPALLDYFQRGMARAEADGATAVILRLDTPGGLDSSMRDMIRTILAAPLPVIGYVAPGGARAASAGTYLMYAAHVAAMAPGTNLGAATPVQIGGLPGAPEPEQEQGQEQEPNEADEPAAQPTTAMERKLVEDAVAYIRSLAELRGRNADWAEQAVRTGASLSSSAALEAGVIDLRAADLDELLQALDGREVTVAGATVTLTTAEAQLERIEHDWRTQLLAVITNPNVAYLLMLIGIYGLIFELANPGALVPGVLGGICLLVALFALQALPINYAGLALIVFGVALMLAEAFVPSFGVLGIGGAIAFAIGSIMLFDTDVEGFQLSLALVAGFSLVSLIVLVGTATMALRARGRPAVAGGEGMIGTEGVALEDFSGRGRVLVHGEAWTAATEQPLRKGQRVRVVAREGLHLQVAPLE